MHVLLINGSPHEKGCTYTALAEVAASLHACGVETELFWLGTQPVAGCIACRKCESVCPQQIRIAAVMADFAGKLEK